ncbi:MAG: serine hydrolase domain-containing protein [Leeuwenhoekiella sp.]
MKKLLTIFSLALLINSCKKIDHTAKAEVGSNKKSIQLDSIYSDLYKQNLFNGNVLIAENGNIIFNKSYGIANKEKELDLNEGTIFELASVSKQFTAMAIVQLVKEGKLNYDDTISKFIPELSFYNTITIENLLYHTSGLPDYFNLADEYWDKSKIATNQDILNLFAQQEPELYFETSTDYEYSNTGYMILASIIEKVSGLAYGDYLKKSIFKPAKMENTFVYNRRYAPKKIENLAVGYIYSDSLQVTHLPDNMTDYDFVTYLDGIVGDGMVNSNVKDLYNWDRILRTEKLVNQSDKERIFQSLKFFDSIPTGYGYGWYIVEDVKFGKYVKHSGGWPGFVTHIERHLDSDKTIIVLQNIMTEQPTIPLKSTRKILYNIPL